MFIINKKIKISTIHWQFGRQCLLDNIISQHDIFFFSLTKIHRNRNFRHESMIKTKKKEEKKWSLISSIGFTLWDATQDWLCISSIIFIFSFFDGINEISPHSVVEYYDFINSRSCFCRALFTAEKKNLSVSISWSAIEAA